MSRLSFSKSTILRNASADEKDFICEQQEYYEQSGNWRNIIFLPYNTLWRILIVFTVLIDCLLVTYSLGYQQFERRSTSWFLYYTFECLYFFDTVLTILHRHMSPYQMTQTYLPKNTYLLLIDVLTLLPYYETYYILELSSKGKAFAFRHDYMMAKVLLRIPNALLFFYNANNMPGLNHVMVTTILQMVLFYLYNIIVSVLFYIMSQHKGRKWTDNLTYHNFRNTSKLNWFILTNTIIGNVLAHNWSGIIKPENAIEDIIFCSTMILGFLMHIMIFFGQLTALYIKKIADQYDFSTRLYVIAKMLDDWGIPSKTKRAAINIYNKFWEKRYGWKEIPISFYTVPKDLRSDCTVDIFWHCFKHSYFFRDMNFAFLKHISLHMKNELYMPGEFLHKSRQIKYKMMYVVSGVVEILSEDDKASAIISFSGGTVLGEISCLMPFKTRVNIRCATYCEIQTLELQALAQLMRKYHGVNTQLYSKIQSRFAIARELQHRELVKLKCKNEKRTSVRWLKKQWHSIHLDHKCKGLTEDKHKQVTVYHTSQYLGLYALSHNEELKEKSICLRSRCPYLLEPASSFRRFCDYLVLAAVILQSVLLPYFAFFTKKLTPLQNGWLYMLDLIYVFGIYLDISTVVRNKKKSISTHSAIIIHKGKQIFTLMDIFATLPLEVLGFVTSMKAHLLLVIRMNRVIKIFRLFRLIEQAQLNVWSNFLQIRLIKYSLLFLYALYFICCLLYGMTCFETCDPEGWLAYNTALKMFLSPENRINPSTGFLDSMFYGASRLLSLKWSTVYAYGLADIIVEYLIVLLGYYMFSFCFAELTACSVLQLEIRNKYQRYLTALRHFAVRTKLPPQHRKFMYNIVDCHWNYNKRYEITGPKSIIKDMPDSLKNEVLINRIVSCLKTIPFFTECEGELVRKVAAIARHDVYPSGTVIMREDTLQVQLNVILRGHCHVESSIPTDKYHKCVMTYSYGNCFPLVEMLLGLNTFLRVTSITSVEVITIAKTDLMVCIKSIDRFHHDVEKVLKKHLDTYYIILTRQKGRLPEMVSRKKASSKSEYFAYDVSDVVKVDSEKKLYADTFKKFAQWEWTKYLLLRKTIEPTGRFFAIWEIARSILAVIYTLYVLFIMKFHLKESLKYHSYFMWTLTMILLVDLYVRMHIRYYNRKGILVTHPLYTASHYVKTSFVLDVIVIFPFEDLKVHTLFGARYKYHALIIICTIIKPFVLYRTINGLKYLTKKSKESRATFYQNVSYAGLVLIILGISANILEMTTCSDLSKSSAVFYSCPNDSWIKGTIYKSKIYDNVYTTSIISYFTVLSIFTTCTVGFFKFETYKEAMMVLILTAGLFSLRWIVLAKIISFRISGHTMLNHYQHDMKVLLKFAKKFCVDSGPLAETVSHYEYVWKKTKEYRTENILRSFPKVLNDDISYYLFSPTLKLTYVLCSADDSTLRFISSSFEQLQFKKHAEIIRCNDVNEYIYIVKKGRVDIFVANDRLCSLTNGGMFGCFTVQGNTRQTIIARTVVSVDVLRISNAKFNKFISIYPKVKQKMTRGRFFKTEYMLPINSSATSAKINIEHSASQIQTLSRLKTFFINPNNKIYVIYDYLTSVHLATLSSLITITVIVTVGYSDIKIYIYLLDIFFLTRILLGFYVTYMDTDTGALITQNSKIWSRYVRSITGLTLDLVTCFPFELVAQFIIRRPKVLNYFMLNRTLRFLFIVKYYTNCKNTLIVSKHLRWTYLMYIMVMLIHLNACIWWLIACPEKQCSYYKRVGHEEYVLQVEEDTLSSYRIAYQYVINVFTTTGLRTVAPTSHEELIATVVMICVAQYILIALTVGFASMLVLDKSVMTNFEREAGYVLKYFTASKLSLSLRNKVWNYYVHLWTRGHGSWMPRLITSAPKYLREDIMFELYGQHLLKHFLFKKTHVDFLRQLVAHFQLCIFLPGMYITQKGNVDNCMYFIDDGAVIVCNTCDGIEVEVQVLEAGKSFGETQGLYGLPHEKSYKARFTCRIIALKKKNWSYLLKWFPASKEQIEQQAGRRLRLQAISIFC